VRYYDEVVVVAAAEAQDEYTGNTKQDWDAATRATLPATVQPAGTQELTDQRQVTITSWTVHCPPAQIAATARIEWGGALHEVSGEVGLFKRRGVPHHCEFTIVRIGS